jgi:hypothetical protein
MVGLTIVAIFAADAHASANARTIDKSLSRIELPLSEMRMEGLSRTYERL